MSLGDRGLLRVKVIAPSHRSGGVSLTASRFSSPEGLRMIAVGAARRPG
jgi:hypothetical protein